MTVTLRPESQGDEVFLRQLILDTVAGELGASEWPEPVRSHILGIQYTSRRQSCRVRFPEAESSVIMLDGAEAGWALVAALPHELRLVEIMVAPELRGRGIGTRVIGGILARARGAQKPVRLRVNLMNPAALRLYERLGFRRTDGDEVQDEMEYVPTPRSAT